MKVFEVWSAWQRVKSHTSFSSRPDAEAYASALRKRGLKQVWIREV